MKTTKVQGTSRENNELDAGSSRPEMCSDLQGSSEEQEESGLTETVVL